MSGRGAQATEAKLAEAARRGRRLSYGEEPPPHDLTERLLDIPTDWLREAAAALPGLRETDLDAVLADLEHAWIEGPRGRLHLEVHPATGQRRGAVVCVHGLGDHVRRATPMAGALAAAGYDTVLLDRPGHGLSEGRRGDSTLADDMAATERAIAYARDRFPGPLALVGDSLGGIMSWYLLPRDPDVDAVVAHCINHPDVHNDPSMRYKAPATRLLARLAPTAPIPVTQIADYSQVALEPLTSSYFSERPDLLFNFTVSARSAASYVGFRPDRGWDDVSIPVLVTIGEEDRMVSRAHTERCLAQAKPPNTTYEPLPGMGHQLYLDHLTDALPPLTEWLERSLPAPAGG